jgi:hypothetical protein
MLMAEERSGGPMFLAGDNHADELPGVGDLLASAGGA